MTAVVFEGETYTLQTGESVLDGLLRNDHNIPYGCRSGVCQACVLTAEADGEIPAKAQQGLSPMQQKQRQFLSCQCVPSAPLHIAPDGGAQLSTATISQIKPLNDRVIGLTLRADINFIPGQYVTLINAHGIARSYSIASTDDADTLEFHIKHIANGAFSDWLKHCAQPGDTLSITAGIGQCVYHENRDQPLLMACMGTGLAPIYGILQDAIKQQHQGDIYVFVGSKLAEELYLVETLQALAITASNVSLQFICLEGEKSYAVTADFYQTVKAALPDLKGFAVYLCGNESFVKKMRKQSFLAGAGMADIHADVFLPFATQE